MTKFDDYAHKYKHVVMERRDGILQMTLHTDGGPLEWGGSPHQELGDCFVDVANDFDTRCIILTGTGDSFISRFADEPIRGITPQSWDHIYFEGKRLLMNLLNIEVPIIAAVNGPATIHAELAVMSDIVIAADHATFRDLPHFRGGLVPGDGVHVIWPLLLGPNRGRYFLLTGQKLLAQEALDLGVVSELMPRDQLLDRAWELAREVVKRPPLTVRYARVAMVQHLKKLMQDNLGYGLALEGLAANDWWPNDD
jgi:enoyl-CoA hydratase/carnithine racemase